MPAMWEFSISKGASCHTNPEAIGKTWPVWSVFSGPINGRSTGRYEGHSSHVRRANCPRYEPAESLARRDRVIGFLQPLRFHRTENREGKRSFGAFRLVRARGWRALGRAFRSDGLAQCKEICSEKYADQRRTGWRACRNLCDPACRVLGPGCVQSRSLICSMVTVLPSVTLVVNGSTIVPFLLVVCQTGHIYWWRRRELACADHRTAQCQAR